MTFETLDTNRLILRKMDLMVYEFVFNNYTQDEQLEFFGLSDLSFLEKEKNHYQSGLTTFNKKFCFFHLIDKTSKKVIGWCGYHTWYIDHDRAEIGYGIYQESFKNKGMMSEAMNAILHYGFDILKLHRIEAFIAAYNKPSLKLAIKFGFLQEGNLRQHYFTNGKHEDSLVYGLLKKDFIPLEHN